jgi:hypothetical protein
MHQGAGRSRKRNPPEADEHLSEAVLHPNLKKSDANPACGAIRLRRTIEPQMGF